MLSPVTSFFDVPIDMCEIVDTDKEESSNKNEVEDELDALFVYVKQHQSIRVHTSVNSTMAVWLHHVPPLLAIVSPPPEYSL